MSADDNNPVHPVHGISVDEALAEIQDMTDHEKLTMTKHRSKDARGPGDAPEVFKFKIDMDNILSPKVKAIVDHGVAKKSKKKKSPVKNNDDLVKIPPPKPKSPVPPKSAAKKTPIKEKNVPSNRSTPSNTPKNGSKNAPTFSRYMSPFMKTEAKLEGKDDDHEDDYDVNYRKRVVKVVYIKRADGMYVRRDREHDLASLYSMQQSASELKEAALEQIHAVEREVKEMFANNPDLREKGILLVDDFNYMIAKGRKSFMRYANYVYDQVEKKDKKNMFAMCINFFYATCCLAVEHLFDVKMQEHFSRLQSNAGDYADILLRNPTIRRVGNKYSLNLRSRSTGEKTVSLMSIGIAAIGQLAAGVAIAIAAKKFGSAGSIAANLLVGKASEAAEGYMFKGKGLLEQIGSVIEIAQKHMGGSKPPQYNNTGDVKGAPIDVEMEDPDDD